jgi:hypothetical protein
MSIISTIEVDFFWLSSGGGGSGSSCTINNTDPIPSDHGGLSAGSVIDGQSSCDVLETILFPAQHPSFTSFAIDSQSVNLEVGDTLSGGVRTFSWSTNNSSLIRPNSVEIKDVTANNVLATNLSNDNTEDVDIGSNITYNSDATHTWSISAIEDASGDTIGRTFSVNWFHTIFYGESVNQYPDESEIENNFNNKLSSSFAGDYSFTAQPTSSYYFIIYPDSLGDITKWVDTDTDYEIDSVYDGTIDITNSSGLTTTCRYLRTTYKQDLALNSRVT